MSEIFKEKKKVLFFFLVYSSNSTRLFIIIIVTMFHKLYLLFLKCGGCLFLFFSKRKAWGIVFLLLSAASRAATCTL